MVQAQFDLDSEDFVLQVEVSGHTDFAKKGSDIVCAAISGQVAMLELGVLFYKKDFILLDKRDGFFLIKGTRQMEVQVLLRSFFFSLLAIQKKYPKHIHIKINP